MIRHTAFAALLHSPNSRLMRTRVDTTFNSDWPAVELGGNARIESTCIRASAGIGVETESSGLRVIVSGESGVTARAASAPAIRHVRKSRIKAFFFDGFSCAG